MICQDCGQQDATVLYTQIISGGAEEPQKMVFHLCRACAEKREGSNFSIEIGITTVPVEESLPSPEGPTCPTCGMTYQEFHSKGRFGCRQCYSTFASNLPEIMKHSHGDTVYRGKVPKRKQSGAFLTGRLVGLHGALQEAIRAERFEEAAQLRDEIAAIHREVDEEEEYNTR